MVNYIYKPAHELVEIFKDSPSEIYEYVSQIYERIKKVEKKLNSFITLRSYDAIIKDVEELIKKFGVKRRKKVRLFGILVAIKDNISTKGIRTTCGSKMLYDYIPPFNATVVDKLLNEGALIIGKTNMDEFAMGSTTENSAFGPTRNPWNLELVPGGSSGGSAVAVSAGEATLALGSDTGGSVRCPASFTGTVGIKPTYGLVSRYGLIAYANSLEQIGPIARNVTDAALLLNVIKGEDPKDSTSLKINLNNDLEKVTPYNINLSKLKLAIIKETILEGVEEDVLRIFFKVIDKLSSEGVKISEVSLPIIKYSLPAYYIIAMAEASSNLARFDGERYGFHIPVEGKAWDELYMEVRSKAFGIEVKRRILLGSFILSAGYRDQYYISALKVRRIIRDSLLKVLKLHDFIVNPTMPVLPFRLGERIVDPLKLYAVDVETILANLAGLPAISIPGGFSNNLPVGIQFMASPLADNRLLSFAKLVEELLNLKDLVPKGV